MTTRLWMPLALAAAACSPEPYSPAPVADPTRIYWSIGLNHRAVTMSTVAPYDTIQLVATPLTIDGQPVKGLPAPTFTSLDLQHIQVGANGLVRALGSGTGFPVVASLSIGNDTHADTAIINVTDTTPAPVMQTLSIQPPPGDSAKVSADGFTFIVPAAYDAAGDSIPNIIAYFATSDSTIATATGGELAPVRPGKVTVYATATVYGVTKSDSVAYTIGYPLLVQINIVPLPNAAGKIVGMFEPSHQQVGPGGVVFFGNANAPATDVTFDNPANVDQWDAECNVVPLPAPCGSGNIPAFAGQADSNTGPTVRVRQFPVPGTYNFHSTISGSTGSIQVMKQ